MAAPRSPEAPDDDAPFRQPPAAHVGRMAARSAKWALLTVVLRQVVTLGSTMIVARMITPGDTGVATMALTVMAFVVLLDTGLTWATVQPRDLSKAQIDGMFWLGVLIGATLWGLCALSGVPLAAFFDTPQLAVVMPVVGLAAFFNSLSTQPAALMKRQLRQKGATFIESTGVLSGALAVVGVTMAGGGYWAMVLQFVAMHGTRAIMFGILAGYRPGPPQFPRESWRLARLGSVLALSNYICFFQLYLGSLLVGKLFGPVDLGYYARANAVKGMPTQYATMVVTDVMVASLAALKGEPDRMAAAYRKALALTAAVGCPAGAFLYVAAHELIGILYGPQWENAVPMLRAFTIVAAVLPISTTTIWLFLATARARVQFLMNVFLTVATLGVFAVGAAVSETAKDLVMVEAVLSATLLLATNLVVSHRAAGIPLKDTLCVVGPIGGASIGALLATTWVFGVDGAVVGFWPNVQSVVVKGLLFGSIYAAVIAPFAIGAMRRRNLLRPGGT